MRSFVIATDRFGPRRWWRVVIHDDLEQLQDAAYRYRRADGVPRAHWDGVEGCCHPAGRLYRKGGPVSWPRNGFRGLVRLAESLLTPEIIAHELVHAAVATLRSFTGGDVRLGNGVTGSSLREEQLAYIYGELFQDLQRQI